MPRQPPGVPTSIGDMPASQRPVCTMSAVIYPVVGDLARLPKWVNRVVLTMGRSLPLFPGMQTRGFSKLISRCTMRDLRLNWLRLFAMLRYESLLVRFPFQATFDAGIFVGISQNRTEDI
jgi:hypothetical protein